MTTELTPIDEARKRGRLVNVLRNRAFLRLWLVQALSQTGQNMVNFALLILVGGVIEQYAINQGNTAIGLAVLSFSVPAIIFSPVAGVVVERANKRTVLILTNALRGIAVVGFLLVEPTWRPLLALSVIYSITFISGTVGQFFGPALGAAIPELVPRRDIVHANALFNLTFTASQLVGFAAVGPLLIKVVGLQPVLIGIIVIFGFCALLSMTIPSTPATHMVSGGQHPFERMLLDMREGIVVIFQTPILLKAIGYLSLATASYLMVAVLGPEFITGVLGLPRQDFAFIIAPAGFGVLAGVLLVGRVAGRLGPERTIDWGITGAGSFLMLLALVGPGDQWIRAHGGSVGIWAIVIAAVLAALLGAANAFVLAPSQSVLQSASPEHVRARVYATFFTVSNAVAFVPIIFAGALADLFGVGKVLFGIGAILLLTGVFQLTSRPASDRSPTDHEDR